MYAPPPYRVDDPDRLCTLIDARPFATLVRNDANGPSAAYLPLARDPSSSDLVLIGHLAKANPFWQGADGGQVVALFLGPDGYISPSSYPSKMEHGRVVPTWNYLRIEARGVLSIETSPDRMRRHVELPTSLMEQDRNPPWSVGDAPGDFVERLSNAIVGVRIDVTSLEGSWKLDQRKSARDREGAIAELRAHGSIALADAMREASPV
jgi:transcriptional regulator